MSYKTISSKEIIAKVYRDFKPSNSNWTSDAIEWIGEAIGFIGYHCGLETKTTNPCHPVKIHHHKGCYPCDLESLIGVVHGGRRLPLGSDVSKAGLIHRHNRSISSPDGNRLKANWGDVEKLYRLTAQLDALEKIEASNPSPATEAEIVDVLRQINLEAAYLVVPSSSFINCGMDYYCVNPDYIITSFEHGEVDLIYVAFPTDDDGFPKILDDSYYKEAVMWYIIRQMMIGGFRHPEFNFDKANQFWELYRGRAANKQKMPSLDKLDQFLASWTKFKFNANLSNDFFINGENHRAGQIDFNPSY